MTANNLRITVRVDEAHKDKIEQRIKREYPKLRNVSDVVRAALEQFLHD
jgi:Arc/MetJ-type ribon-helix-helix transcriptional regulator